MTTNRKEYMCEYMKRYYATEKGKTNIIKSVLKFNKTPKGKKLHSIANKNYYLKNRKTILKRKKEENKKLTPEQKERRSIRNHDYYMNNKDKWEVYLKKNKTTIHVNM